MKVRTIQACANSSSQRWTMSDKSVIEEESVMRDDPKRDKNPYCDRQGAASCDGVGRSLTVAVLLSRSITVNGTFSFTGSEPQP